MALTHVQFLEVFPFHEPGGARLRRALTDSCGWEIRARRSLAPPFMVQMRGSRTVEAFHEPQGRAGCPQPAGPRRGEDTAPYRFFRRFMVPIRYLNGMSRAASSSAFISASLPMVM